MAGTSELRAVCLSLVVALSLLLSAASGQRCGGGLAFSQGRAFSVCSSLPRLGASLHWNYNPSTRVADIAFRAPQNINGYISWAINPTGTGMAGSQAIVAQQNRSTSSMVAYTTPMADKSPSMVPGALSFNVANISAEFDGGSGTMTLYASVSLPGDPSNLHQVWQTAPLDGQGTPDRHALSGDNLLSFGNINFISGAAAAASDSRIQRRNIHGVLNVVSWGIMMPMGAIIARYLKVFKSADPAWFYLHVGCQISAYIIGVSGWGTGLKLGSESTGVTYADHRNIGIALFVMATLQVFALLLRPQKDHKYRIYWNVYHHSVGYSVLTLSIVNILKGFKILDPVKKWKHAYVGVLIALGAAFFVLEVTTWIIVLRRRSRNDAEKSHRGNNAFGARPTQAV